jgi:RND family efflux transporter MFP subunit
MNRTRALAAGATALVAIFAGTLIFGNDGNEPEARVERGGRAQSPTTAERKSPASAVAALAPAAPGLDPTRPTDCLIEPSQVVRVNSGVEGVIDRIFVERGDVVRRGQIVAQLRADVDRAGLSAAQARAANVYSERAAASRAAYLESVRQRSEQIGQYIARDKVEEAQANARAAAEERSAAAQERRVAQLEATQTARVMSEKTVRSPVNGIVTERSMSPGEYRGPDASHIVTIAQVDPLNVEVFAPIAQLGSVKVGDLIAVHPEEPVGGEYFARVKVIDRVFDAASGTFGMRLELRNPNYKLPAGLRCRIEFAEGKKGA